MEHSSSIAAAPQSVDLKASASPRRTRRTRLVLLTAALLVVTLVNVHEYLHLQLRQVVSGCRPLEKSHIDPTYYRQSTCLTRDQVLAVIQELVFTAADVLEAHNVTYFLDSGTLLGAFRNQSVIAHDNDADMGIDAAGLHYLQHHTVNFPPQYTFTVWNSSLYPNSDRDDKLPARLIHKDSGIYLDVFAFLDWSDTTTGAAQVGPLPSWCFLNCAGCPNVESGGKSLRVPRDWIFPVIHCAFEGRLTLKCPRKTQQYLEYTFGEDYMTPVKYTY